MGALRRRVRAPGSHRAAPAHRFRFGATAVGLAAVMTTAALPATIASGATPFPQYNHVFLIIEENEGFNNIIGNPAAPEINALANDYGLATAYTGVSDPSEPNYVAMLGGSDFGINNDDPYFFPGNTVSASNLLSEMDAAGQSWKGYFQDMPYPGFRGYCYPAKCNGIPDSDTEYVAKHNGIVNFANLQNPTDMNKMVNMNQLGADLSSGSVPNFSYIVPDECHDMHGAPPWCVDSAKAGSTDDTQLVAAADTLVGQTVNQITSSPVWSTGNNAIVVTWDEGNTATSKIATIVATNHGDRGVTDNTSYNHYSLLASLQASFGLGCLLNSCTANLMTPLFQVTASTGAPTLPPPFNPGPDGSNTISATGSGVKGTKAKLSCASGWSVVPSPSIGNQDNNLAAVSAASSTDAWAIGSYIPGVNGVLEASGEHWDGTSWTEYPLPDVGPNENSLLSVSELPSGHTYAAGYFLNASFQQQTLIEYYNASTWSLLPSPSPGALQNILYGVSAISDTDVWAVGADQDAAGVWHTLTMNWNGTTWTQVPAVDAGASGNQFFAVTAVSPSSVYATGQQAGSGFPSQMLTEHWDGSSWSVLATPSDPTETLTPEAITGNDTTLSVIGYRESGSAPYTTLVASGAPSALSVASTPNNGAGEQDLFGAATASDGSTWAVGWDIDPATGVHSLLVEQAVNGTWSIVPAPSPGKGDVGLASVAAVPGGDLWAVGVTSGTGNFSTLTEFHC